MIVVDTNVWSELTRRTPDDRVRQWEAANAHQLWMSAIVLAELRAGAALLPEGRNRALLSQVIEEIATLHSDRILPFDERCAGFYGAVLASAKQAGRPIMTADAMIAATALCHGLAVATRDTNDFSGAGVRLINPWNA